MSGYVCRHGKDELGFVVEYDEALLPLLRSLPAAHWDKNAGLWACSSAPGSLDAAVAIGKKMGLEFYADALELIADRSIEGLKIVQAAILRAQKQCHRLGYRLRPRQDEGIAFLALRDTGLLAAEPGTGKTMMSLMASRDESLLVVGPQSAKYVWEEQTGLWRPDLKPVVLKPGKANFRMPESGEMVVTTYASLPKPEPKGRTFVLPPGLVPPKRGRVILDEAHRVKEPSAQQTRAARALVRAFLSESGGAWGMTGTPIQNRPSELWSLLYSLRLAEQAFGSWPQFCSLFEQVDDGWGHMSMGLPKPELRERLTRVMFQMPLVLEVGEPEVNYLSLDVDMTAAERAEGQRLFTSWRDAAGTPGETVKWAALAPYRKLLAAKKAEALSDYIATFEEADEPLVVFCCHIDPVEKIGSRKGWTYITGDVDKDRKSRTADFQAGKLKGIALTTRAGSESVTLTRARSILLVDLDYNPTQNTQAIARVHRTGQTRRVRVTIAVARGTVDRDILTILEAKTRLIEATKNPA